VGVVSHELKTPVAVIQAYTDVLLRRAERTGDSANLDVLQRIGEQSERMLYMVEQVLDLQRLEAGLMSLEPSRFDLTTLIERVAEELGSTTSQHQLTVKVPGPLPVVADRRRIEEVLQNLLQNAIKFSPNGGQIEVVAALDEQSPGRVVVAVSDQGVGISPEEQPRRFYQGRSRLYQGHVGLGLGLYISREIIRRHGGDMWLRSEPGVGSTLYFGLPVAGPDEGEP
jgi:signal transduction histidine kinase